MAGLKGEGFILKAPMYQDLPERSTNQGGILVAKVPRILVGSLEPSVEVLLQFWDIAKNHAILL